MLTFGYSVLGFLLAIAILVTVHEFGHYWVAKKLGVKILRFSVGFGKPLWSKVAGADQTEYRIAAIPLGGYVKMLGEEDDDYSETERHRAFNNQALWKRAAIVFAGPAINFLFAILIYAGLFLTNIEAVAPIVGDVPEQSVVAKAGLQAGDRVLAIDGKKFNYFGEHRLYIFNQILKRDGLSFAVERNGKPMDVTVSFADVSVRNLSPSYMAKYIGFEGVSGQPVITGLADDMPAKVAGLLPEDEPIAVNGVSVKNVQHFIAMVRGNGEQTADFTVRRGEQTLQFAVQPKVVEYEGQQTPQIGIALGALPIPEEYRVNHDYSLPQAAARAVSETWLMSAVTLRMFGKMLTLQASPKNVSGPITIAQVAGDALQISLEYFLNILAVVSISLGVINLLPIPMLDGGHLLFYVVEAVKGSPVSDQWQILGQKIGMFLLACLMSLAFYNDIFRLLS